MTDADIERRLRLPLTTMCLAIAGKCDAEDLREAKDAIVREVARIVHDATNPHARRNPGEETQ